MLLLPKNPIIEMAVDYPDATPSALFFSHTQNPFSKFLKNILVKVLINRCVLKRKLFINEFLAIKNTNLRSTLCLLKMSCLNSLVFVKQQSLRRPTEVYSKI